MIGPVIVGVLAVLALWFVLSPLGRPRLDEENEESLELDEARSKKRAAIAALDEMESDRAMGKLAARDYDVLRRDYEREAAAALHDLDALRDQTNDDDLEAEIAAVRQRLERAGRKDATEAT